MSYDTVIRNAQVVDGRGVDIFTADVALKDGRIARVAENIEAPASEIVEAGGRYLAPGFIDVHTHDDLEVINNPDMLAKTSQGVTSVIVGNCGISASPVRLTREPPDPLNLLGDQGDFVYSRFSDYVRAVTLAKPSVNVAALVGHTALRNNHMKDLTRTASVTELSAMSAQLHDALAEGALGMSSGLAYANAQGADINEVLALVKELKVFGAIYTTHLRTEFDQIIEALGEALDTAASARVPLVVSHLKCAGKGNWGRSTEVLAHLEAAAHTQKLACDCYPYSASSSTLDLKQVTGDSDIFITWSRPHPDQGGRPLADIARDWNVSLLAAAEALQPAGAVYHCMDPEDVRTILKHPLTMVGSDGLPNDPHPHPRLWGAFPRVLAHYCRDEGLFDLPTAVHKMSGRSAAEFNLTDRGLIAEGYYADLVLFDWDKLESPANYLQPVQRARGIESVWVNGVLSYQPDRETPGRAGQFLYRKNQ
ncbi:N-acyl-D-amino-acid deacylase family protein [Marinimicrobium alkaliphilum]|uniref:N-acyl-D-amino-acid deacylase family protein n=1 Tax=Marinimicrobium alkaliphilum TaxID=2202654 RepID=UPI000DB92272|nr:D-aminoacylase [Marinimicrobium alkaliphilum]